MAVGDPDAGVDVTRLEDPPDELMLSPLVDTPVLFKNDKGEVVCSMLGVGTSEPVSPVLKVMTVELVVRDDSCRVDSGLRA